MKTDFESNYKTHTLLTVYQARFSQGPEPPQPQKAHTFWGEMKKYPRYEMGNEISAAEGTHSNQ